MTHIYFSTNMNIIDEWKNKDKSSNLYVFYDLESLNKKISELDNYIVFADYDSVAHDINNMITSDTLPDNTIILETSPEISTGQMLINSGIKAYGNSRMLKHHFEQMISTVTSGKNWTYPELTASLVESIDKKSISKASQKIIKKRLTNKEIKVVYLVLKGLTNDAIAKNIGITTRTVKAHISSIFAKLHVNDRVSLILLLK